jgi:hypothetical protein
MNRQTQNLATVLSSTLTAIRPALLNVWRALAIVEAYTYGPRRIICAALAQSGVRSTNQLTIPLCAKPRELCSTVRFAWR